MHVAAVAVTVRPQLVPTIARYFVSHHRMYVAAVAVTVRAQRVPTRARYFCVTPTDV